MGQAAGKALSVGGHGSFSPNGERMWAGHCLLLTFLLAALLEVVVMLVAPSSIEAALAGWRNGSAKCPSLWSSNPQDGLREIRWKNALQLGKGTISSPWLAVGWGHGLRDSSACDGWRATRAMTQGPHRGSH